ncbi:uncharacterized protein LOC135077361 [Ostrinia nubilalis]|uniref:uncharacterized protein LOC135077361 n=1 Tax=Ostrinia nubilalis TaxID=29057 RepID=UPI0030823A0F
MVKPVNCNACVHSLNLRFNGKDSVQDFIVRIEELCLSRNISREKLFNSAVELFTDDALFWYRGTRDQLNSWEDLKASLLEEYLPYDYDHRLLQEIRSRTQGPDESICSYLSLMQNYFSRLRKPLDDEEKLSLVKFNIRPSYSIPLVNVEIKSWADLKRHCRQLEAARQRAESFTEPPRGVQNAVAPDLAYKSKSARPKCEAVVKSLSMEKFCVRCRVKDHTLRDCKAPHVVICYRCGEKGVTAVNCPKCVRQKDVKVSGVTKRVATDRRFDVTPVEEWRAWCDFVRAFSKNYKANVSTVRPDDCQDARPYLNVEIGGVPCSGLLDSGAEVSIVGGSAVNYFSHLGELYKSDSTDAVVTANGSTSPTVGYMFLPVVVNDVLKVIKFYVVPGVSSSLLFGINFWKAFQIAPDVLRLVNRRDSIVRHAEAVVSQRLTGDAYKDFKHPNQTTPGLFGKPKVRRRPFQCVSVGFVGSLPRSRRQVFEVDKQLRKSHLRDADCCDRRLRDVVVKKDDVVWRSTHVRSVAPRFKNYVK